jgi:hypothetical protein
MKVSLAKVFEMIDYEAEIEPINDKSRGVFVSTRRLKERLVQIEEECWKDCEHIKLKGLQGSATLLRTLKDDLNRHLNTIGVTDSDELNAELEIPAFCDCGTEDICETKREAIAKLIKVLE